MKIKVTFIIIILLTTLLSGCLEKSEHDFAREALEQQFIDNDRSKPYHEVWIGANQVRGEYICRTIVNGTIEIYKTKQSILSEPFVMIPVVYGAGRKVFDISKLDLMNNDTESFLHSRTLYDIGFNGGKDWYDILNHDVMLPEYSTFDETLVGGLTFDDVQRVGSFNNMVYARASQEIDLSITNSFDFTITVSGNYGRVKNPVLSFVDDGTHPFEGTEFKSVTLERVSGANFNAPYDITDIVKGSMWGNVPLYEEIDNNDDRWINAGSGAIYRVTFHDIQYDQLNMNGTMKIYLDDLDGYLNPDVFKSTKADAVEIATVFSSVYYMSIGD